ncbi:MAG: hypothetical protein ACYC5O_24700 [Anaerolineae bacterium]
MLPSDSTPGRRWRGNGGPGAILLGVALVALPQLLFALGLVAIEHPVGRRVPTPSS